MVVTDSPPQPDVRSRRPSRTTVATALLTAAGLLTALAVAGATSRPVPAAAGPAPAVSTAAQPGTTAQPSTIAQPGTITQPGTSVDNGRPTGIAALRARAQEVPDDPGAWTSLGFAALENARASADPAQYAEAADAFDRSLRVRPTDNVLALAGQAAIADALHEFADGERRARTALAVDPTNPVALAALVDALTELGRYPAALEAANALDAAQPGVASFTRLSYQAELRGRTADALTLLRRAAEVADSPSQVAFARAQEGLLALGSGNLTTARAALTAGRLVAPDDTSLLHLSARLAWAAGDTTSALAQYATLVARRPAATWAGEQAELLAATGDQQGASVALDLARASYRLTGAAGVQPESTQVVFEADHGSPDVAVRLGATLVARAPSVGNLDAYAWALHRAGRDREALAPADRALALGERSATALYHRGVIRAALDDTNGARSDLTTALALDPRFSPLHAPQAVALLARLGGAR